MDRKNEIHRFFHLIILHTKNLQYMTKFNQSESVKIINC